MRLIRRSKINWGVLGYSAAFCIYLLIFVYVYFLAFLMKTSVQLSELKFLLFLLIPFLALGAIFFPILKSLLMSALYKNVWSVEIYDKGIKIKERFHDWGKIKSISFQTGRLVHDYSFFEGPRLPALQKIYLLDMEGKEFSCVIDIDYFLKENRNKNNLVIIKESLFDCGKGQIISDWAEKR